MDNRSIELRAENEISKQLTKMNLFVCKPLFDKLGSDLLIIENIQAKPKLTIVQSKGRSIECVGNSNVKINSLYVTPNFIVFVYIEDKKNASQEYLYCFFEEDVKAWNKNSGNFILYIPNKFSINQYFQTHSYYGNTEKQERIKIISQTSKLDLASFAKDISLGLQSVINWRENDIIPSLEVMHSIYDRYDITKSSLTQDILLYISGIIREGELERRIDEFHHDLSFEFLTNTFIASSINLASIFDELEISKIHQYQAGACQRYLGYSKYIIIEMTYKLKDIETKGLYCFVKDDAVDAIELLIHKSEQLESMTNLLTGTGRELQNQIIEISSKI